MKRDDPLTQAGLHICSRCIYDERVSGITFDAAGVCNYCHQFERLKIAYGTGTEQGEHRLAQILEDIRRAGHGKPYDCVVGVSGGTDSSYLIVEAKDGAYALSQSTTTTLGTRLSRPRTSTRFSRRSTSTSTRTWSITRNRTTSSARFSSPAWRRSRRPPTSRSPRRCTVLRGSTAYGYVLEGHSFLTEGITPVGRNYFDGRYIQLDPPAVRHRAHADVPAHDVLSRFLFWSCVARIRKIRPFWYVAYTKEDAARVPGAASLAGSYYGGHHLENRMTAFCHGIYAAAEVRCDLRNNALAARARNGHDHA